MLSSNRQDTTISKRVVRLGIATVLIGALSGCVEIRMPDPDVVYIAFGNSTTAGPSTRDYPDILRELLGKPSESFANEGSSGETSSEGLTRLRGLFSNEIFPNAETLLYWESGNDITAFIKDHDPFVLFSPMDADYPFTAELLARLDATQDNIEAAIGAAQGGGLDVYVATYFTMREDLQQCDALPLDVILPVQAQRANAYITLLNARIRAAVAATGATLVDVAIAGAVLRSDPANYHNCNHLSAQGNAVVAQLFFDALSL